jgi:hypothetical protein
MRPTPRSLAVLHGLAFASIRCDTDSETWHFGFEGGAALTVSCPWRLVVAARIEFGASDEGHRFGLPATIDGCARVTARLAGRRVVAATIGDCGDLTLDFGEGIRVDVFHDSSGYEGWQCHLPGASAPTVAVGGGEVRGLLAPDAGPAPSNALIAIHPYRHEGLWVFDDPRVGLSQEPFVSGADAILDALTAPIDGAASGFTLLFSAGPFPGASAAFEWLREDRGGNWYRCDALGLEGWLCPALFRYFAHAPSELYVQVSAKRG